MRASAHFEAGTCWRQPAGAEAAKAGSGANVVDALSRQAAIAAGTATETRASARILLQEISPAAGLSALAVAKSQLHAAFLGGELRLGGFVMHFTRRLLSTQSAIVLSSPCCMRVIPCRMQVSRREAAMRLALFHLFAAPWPGPASTALQGYARAFDEFDVRPTPC